MDDGEGYNSRDKISINIEDFTDYVKSKWRDDYKVFFSSKLPELENDLKEDLIFVNHLYNPVFLSYSYKNAALKSEYAYLYCLSQENPDKPLNFGVVINRDESKDSKKRTILIASDGGLNLPNRLHTPTREFTEFLEAYTGHPLVRVYEGFKDFTVGTEYVSSQLLVPVSKDHEKYLKLLKKGQLPAQGDNISRITQLNLDFIDHAEFSMQRNNFMKRFCIAIPEVDKKGKVKNVDKQQVEFLDLRSNKIYFQGIDGDLIEKNTENTYGDGLQTDYQER